MSLLSVKNLTINFKNDQTNLTAVRNVSFNINPGTTVALVGASGSGKTITALSILRLLPVSNICSISGEIWFKGINLLGLNNNQMRQVRGQKISMIFQVPMMALNPLHPIRKQIAENIIINSTLSVQQIDYRIDELLTLVGLDELKKRGKIFPHEISGGQRQRVMIAMSIANRPPLLIADEPTTSVDVVTQSGILKLLSDLQDEFKIGILMITHDLNVVRNIANDVYIMNQGEIVEKGSVHSIWTHPQNQYTQDLIAAEPAQQTIPIPKNYIPLMQGKHISVNYEKKQSLFTLKKESTKILDHVSFTIGLGQTLGIVGESGSGKTTLAQAILKLIPFRGELYFDQQKLHCMNAKKFRPYRRSLQLVFQDPYGSLNPRFTIYSILKEGLTVHHPNFSPNETDLRIRQAILDVNLDDEALSRYPHQFSGGQRQRIALARILILKPKLIILDEPTSALDRIIQKDILNLLSTVQNKYNLSYLLISHDLSVMRAMAHHIMVLKNGRVIEYDTALNIFSNPQQEYTKQLMSVSFNKEVL